MNFVKHGLFFVVLSMACTIGVWPNYFEGVGGADSWQARLAMARLWRDAVNRHGGDVTVVHLPEVGLKGNTHFPLSDLNNIQVADLLSKFLKEKELD